MLAALIIAGCATPGAPHSGASDAGAPLVACSASCERLVATEPGHKSVEAIFVSQDPLDRLHSTIMVDFASCHSNTSSDCFAAEVPCINGTCPRVAKPGAIEQYSRIYTTRDGGRTYTLAKFAAQDRSQGSTDEGRLDMTSSVAGGPPVMTMLGDGSVLVVGSRNLPIGSVDVVGAYSRPEIRMLKSTDGGLAFPPSRAIVNTLPGGTSDEASRDVPNEFTVAADKSSAILCWVQADPTGIPGPATLNCTTTADGGKAWSDPARVALSPIFIGNPVSSIGDNGTAFVGWLDADSQTSFRPMISKGSIGHAEWSSVPISAEGSVVTAMVAHAGGLDVAMVQSAKTAGNFTLKLDRLDAGSWRTRWTSAERGDVNCAYARLTDVDDAVVIGWGSRPMDCGSPDAATPTPSGIIVIDQAGRLGPAYVPTNTMAPAVTAFGHAVTVATARWSATGTDVFAWVNQA